MPNLTIQESGMTMYGFTLRKTKSPQTVTQADYTKHMFDCFAQPGVQLQQYVHETKSGLHYHGVITVTNDFNLNRLRVRGWRLDLVHIYNRAGWLFYTSKQNTPTTVSTMEPLTPEPQRVYPERLTKKLFSNTIIIHASQGQELEEKPKKKTKAKAKQSKQKIQC